MGYSQAGFTEIVGVDIVPQPNYPFEFIQDDVFALPVSPKGFDLIHASPPCQRFSDLAHRNGNGHEWPDLIEPTRAMLVELGVPYVIENVEGAPLLSPAMLCGTMFSGLRVIRHRLFEMSFDLVFAPYHDRHPLVFTHDKRKNHYGRLDQNTSYVQVTGGGNSTVANARAAMGIDWMTKPELNEAIPPAYTKFIGEAFLNQMSTVEGAT